MKSKKMSAFFTSVRGKELVQVAIQRVKSDPTWKERTLMTPKEFGDLLQMVVETTYFRFQGKMYKQTFSMSIGSSISPGLPNLFMEVCG